MLISLDEHLERCAREGDADAAAALFETHRPRLLWMVAACLSPRLRPRVPPAEIVDAALERAVDISAEYFDDRLFPRGRPTLFQWLWTLTVDQLAEAEVAVMVEGLLNDLDPQPDARAESLRGETDELLACLNVESLSETEVAYLQGMSGFRIALAANRSPDRLLTRVSVHEQ